MYKDVWKRVFAVVLTLCLVVTLVQWPTTVKAEEVTYHDYQHGGSGDSMTVEAMTGAAVFTAGKNENLGAEILSGASFDVYLSENEAGGTKATVAYYLNPGNGMSDPGEFVCSEEIYDLVEGTNRIDINIDSVLLEAGDTFSIVVTLEGEGIFFYADEGMDAGKTYTQMEDGSWKDTGTEGSYLTIRATTYDAIEEEPGFIDQVKSIFSPDAVEAEGSAKTPSDSEKTEITGNGTETVLPESSDYIGDIQEGTEDSEIGSEIPEDHETEGMETADKSETEKAEDENTQKNSADSTKNIESEIPPETPAGNEDTEKPEEISKIELFSAGDTGLNKSDMVLGVDSYGEIILNNPQADVRYHWEIPESGKDIAEITPNGDGYNATVYAKAIGSTVIHVSDEGGTVEYTCNLTVTANIKNVTVDVENIVYDGENHTPSVIVKDGDKTLTKGKEYTFDFTPVSEAGSYDFTIVGQSGHYSGTRTETFVIERKSLKDSSISMKVDRTSLETGTMEDSIVITDSARGVDLNITDDYLLKPVTTTTGDSGMQASGQNNYKDDIEIKTPVSIAGAIVELPADAVYVYTGQAWQPTSIEVRVDGVLLDGNNDKDYKVEYSPNVNAGPVTITIEGQNNYYGTASADFVISPKDISNKDQEHVSMKVEVKAGSAAETGDPVVAPIPKIDVTYNGMKLVSDQEDPVNYDYRIGTPEINGSQGKVMLYGGGTNYTGEYQVEYSVGSDISSVVTGIEPITGIVYNGKEQEPSVELITTPGVSLTEGQDYKIRFDKNINAGEADVIIEGRGSYGGDVTAHFTIEKASMDEWDYNYDTKLYYSPIDIEDMKPELKITFRGEELKLTDEYTLTYSIDSETDPGAGGKTITVAAAGSNFISGTTALPYTVEKCPLSGKTNPAGRIEAKLTNGNKFTYTGNPVNPGIELTYYSSDGRSEVLQGLDPAAGTTGPDYTVDYDPDYTNVNDNIKISVMGSGNYNGSIMDLTFQISKISINTMDIVVDSSQTGLVSGYNGPYLAMLWLGEGSGKLQLTLKDKKTGQILDPDKDYELEYDNYNVMSSSGTGGVTAKVTIKGKKSGNYGGSATFYYLIAKKLENCTLSVEGGTKVYTGDAIEFTDLKVKDEDTAFLSPSIVLESGYDFTVKYDNNINAKEVSGADASVVIQAVSYELLPTKNGCYAYGGSPELTEKFAIARRSISDAELPSGETIRKEYKDGAVTLLPEDIELTFNKKKLDSTKDFTIIADGYNNNTIVTEDAEAVVSGEGNFTGKKQIPFVITGKSLATAAVTVDPVTYDGEPQYPAIKLTDESTGIDLVKGTDYTYSNSDFSNNVNAGEDTAKVTITGKGKYAGDTRDIVFSIDQRNIAEDIEGGGSCQVTGITSPMTYTSRELKQAGLGVKFKMHEGSVYQNLADGDYEVNYDNNINANMEAGKDPAVIIIKGTGNYTGTYQDATFKIAPKDIGDESEVEIAEIEPQPFTGTRVQPIPEITYTTSDGAYKLDLNKKDFELNYDKNLTLGTASVSITGTGNFTGTRTTTFRITDSIVSDKITITCAEDGRSFVYTGKAYAPTVEVRSSITGVLSPGSDYEVVCDDNINAGLVTVTVRGIDNYSGEKEFHFTITPKNVGDEDVILEIEGKTDGTCSKTYTGEPIHPEVKVKYKDYLSTNDFVVVYGENIPVNSTKAGTVSVKVSGTSRNYYGDKTGSFKILPRSIGSGNAFASGFSMDEIPPQGYLNGLPVQPAPIVRYNGNPLPDGSYSFTYNNNTAIGTAAEIMVHGTNNYTGTVKKTFEIKSSLTGAKVKVPQTVYFEDYYDAATNKAEVTFKPEEIKVSLGEGANESIIDATNYDVSYDKNDAVGVATIIIKGKTDFAETVSQSFTIKGKPENVNVEVGDQRYTGSPITVKPKVTYFGKLLEENTDYFITGHSNNTNIGSEATVTITLNKYYGGTQLTAKFNITADGDVFQVSGIEASYKYRGEAIHPSVTVKAGGKTLRPDVDYEIIYGTNTNVGSGVVLVQGKGSFNGIIEPQMFEITAQKLEDLTILSGDSMSFGEQEYIGKEIVPDINVVYKNGNKNYTIPSSDYTVTKKEGYGNTAVGEGCIVITPNDNGERPNIVGGAREIKFQIVPKDITEPKDGTADDFDISLSSYNYTYDGTAHEPEVYVKYKFGPADSDILELKRTTETVNGDYTVTYTENLNAGEAVVKIDGNGNYTGHREIKFNIAKLNITNASELAVTLVNGYTYPYMGDETGVRPEVKVTLNGMELKESAGEEKGDYYLEYKDNTKLGSGKIVVHGDGNLTGTRAPIEYTITAHSMTADDIVIADIENQPYTGSPIFPEVTIMCGDYKLKQNTDFHLEFDGDHTELGVVNLTICGDNGFSGSRPAQFTIASGIGNAEVTGLKESYPFIGRAYTVEELGITKVQIGDTVLDNDSYSIEFAESSDGLSAGSQTLVIRGRGEYGGSKTLEFTISQKMISDLDVVMEGFVEDIPYSEDGIEQNISLSWGGIVLENPRDYTVSYKLPVNGSNICTMTVEGHGNYGGNIIKNYTVQQTDIKTAKITNMSTTYTYTGEKIEPEPYVWMNDTKLKKGVDYELKYSDNVVDAGVKKITISGLNNHYTGSLEISYNILRKSILLCKFGEIETQVYTGKDVEPNVTVENGKLKQGQDYTLMYQKNREAGSAVAVVAGKNNYTATKMLRFDIRPGNVQAISVVGSTNSSISLGWSSSGVVTGYEIHRAGADGKYTKVAKTKGTAFTDTKLTSGGTYTYKIRAYVTTATETYYGSFSQVVKGNT